MASLFPDSPRLHLVTGKGGVGKTHTAALLSVALARAGRRVLAAEFNGGGRLHAHLGVATAGYAICPVPALPGLQCIDITAQAATREYALMILRIEALYRAVFENTVVRHFVRLVPSLGELTMLGKVWYHTQPPPAEGLGLDDIVVDLPATGHALSLLGAPRAVRETVSAGPMHDQGERLHDMLTDAQHTRLHVVTRAEDMPVTEAQEILTGAAALGVPLGALVVNQQPAALPEGWQEALASLAGGGPAAAVPDALARREARRQQGEQHLARLGAAAEPGRRIVLPQLSDAPLTAPAQAAAAAPFAALVAERWQG